MSNNLDLQEANADKAKSMRRKKRLQEQLNINEDISDGNERENFK